MDKLRRLPKKWWILIVLIATMIGLLFAVILPSFAIRVQIAGGSLFYGVEIRKAMADATITSLGAESYKGEYVTFDTGDGLAGSTGEWLIVCYAGDAGGDDYHYFYDDSTSTQYDFTRDARASNAGQAVADIWSLKLSVDIASGDYLVFGDDSNGAMGITVYRITELDSSPFDKTSYMVGSGNNAGTDETSVLSQDVEVCVAVTAVEDEVDDPHGSWTEDTGYVYGNEQFAATNDGGDSSNMQVHSVVRLVSDGTSQGYRGVDAGHDDTDFAGTIVTYKVSTATTSLANEPDQKNYGTVEKNASYWSSGSEPSWPLTDDDALFTITNDGDVAIDICISSTDFDGGGGWNLVTSAPGVAEARMLAFKEGDGNTDNITIINTPTLFIEDLDAEDDIDWELRLDVPTESDGYVHSAHITLEASGA